MTPASTQEAGPAAESKSSKLVEPGALWSSNSSWVSIRPTTTGLILLSFVLHLGLLLYANHVDSHPERFGGLTYTDVDWSVVSDGAVLIVRGGDDASTRAKGWLVRLSGWRIGDPYNRSTFRYSPLLPLLLTSTVIHPLLGKLVLVLISLTVPLILLRSPIGATPSAGDGPAPFWPTHLLWTLNPFVLHITTRGSPEAVIVLSVIATIGCLRAADRSSVSERESGSSRAVKWENCAAFLYALSISYKIYPIIYAPAIWVSLRQRHGWIGRGVWRFGIVTAVALVLINGILWSTWGQPFLQHTFLYHLTRLDHRHNFSPYFYPIYLSLFPSTTPFYQSALLTAIRHPLASFVPQFALVLVVGFLLTPHTGLVFAMFVQTASFVVFNKVCTSQYFMWFLPLLPPLLPHLNISSTKAGSMIALWIAGQAVWLGTAYRLEFLAEEVYLTLWAAGIGLFAISVWVLGEVIEGFDPGLGRRGKAN